MKKEEIITGENIKMNEFKLSNTQSNPKITVIIRTHNSEDFVEKAIKSAFNQTLSMNLYEILVVDDGSIDGTKRILKSYEKKIRIVERFDVGNVKAINIGLNQAKGEYIILLDSDDTFEPTILEEMYTVLEKDGEISFVYSDYFEYYEYKDIKKIVSLEKNIFDSVACGILFRRYILEAVGGYNENLIFPEYDLLIKIMKKYKGKYISRPLFTYVRRKESITADKDTVEKGKKQLVLKYGEKLPIRGY